MLAPVKLVLNIFIGAVEFFLGLRFLLLLFGANPRTPFVAWVYEMSAPLLAPFQGIFPARSLNGYVFDFSTLFAFFAYVFAGYILYAVIAAVERASSRV